MACGVKTLARRVTLCALMAGMVSAAAHALDEASLPTPSRLPDFRICTLLYDIRAHLLAERVPKRVAWYEGRQLERLLQAFKAETSQQEIAGDGLLVATYPGIRDVLFLFQQGCYLADAERPPGWAAKRAGEP